MSSATSQQAFDFFKTFTVVLLGIILFDQLIGRGLSYLYSQQKSGLLYRTSYAIDSTRAEYIVAGSSRANHDYDPTVFENMLKVSFYNCGRDKQGLIYSCAVISGILERYRPKYIIIDIRPDEFSQSDEGTLSTILPYQNNAAVAQYFKYNSKFDNLKLLSKIYPYNSLLTNLVVGLNKNWGRSYKGYIKLTGIDSNLPLEKLEEPIKANDAKIKVFRQLLTKIGKERIPVMLVISPIRYNYKSTVTVNQCLKLSKSFPNVKFLNFTDLPQWYDYKLYSDNNHLNAKGAAIYSAALATYLR